MSGTEVRGRRDAPPRTSPGGPDRPPDLPPACRGTPRGPATNWPKWAVSQCPRAPSPCSRIVSMRPLRRREIGDCHQLGPAEVSARRLCARRPDEQVALAELLGQVREPVLDRAVQVADGCEVLQLRARCRPRHQRAPPRARARRCPLRRRAPCLPGARGTGNAVTPARRTASASGSRRPDSGARVPAGSAGSDAAPRRSLRARSARARGAASPRWRRGRPRAPTVDGFELLRREPSSVLCFSENAANRYWHMIPCSSSAA